MKPLSQYITTLLAWFCFAALLASCNNVDDEAADNEAEQSHAMLSIVMRGMPASGSNDANDGYDVGIKEESIINDYRIFFFDTDNKYLGRCSDSLVISHSSDYTEYEFIGVVPEIVEDKSEFKLVVLANWGESNYGDDNLVVGTTTISDMCEAVWAKYSYSASTTANILNGAGIPFFGVRTYSDVSFTKGSRTTLTDPITLLRAVAKVEVMKKQTDASAIYDISSVTLTNYNTEGYCAPLVTERSDYDHDYTWSSDFARDIHIVEGKENSGTLAFTKYNDTWIIYIPEYRNLNDDGTVRSDDKESVIQVKFDFQKDDEEPFKIYFAEYTDSKAGARVDIHRNNLYRYTLNYTVHQIFVETGEWTDVFDNTIEFKK